MIRKLLCPVELNLAQKIPVCFYQENDHVPIQWMVMNGDINTD